MLSLIFIFAHLFFQPKAVILKTEIIDGQTVLVLFAIRFFISYNLPLTFYLQAFNKSTVYIYSA